MAVDPVCKMTVEPAKAAAQSTHKGQTYYFCAVGCKQKFDREPEKYLDGQARQPSCSRVSWPDVTRTSAGWRRGPTTSRPRP